MLTSSYIKGSTHLLTHALHWTTLLFEFPSVVHIFALSITLSKPNFSLSCESQTEHFH
jgi:hypothetical protein